MVKHTLRSIVELQRYNFTSDSKIIKDEKGQWIKAYDAYEIANLGAIYCNICEKQNTCSHILYGGCVFSDNPYPENFVVKRLEHK